MIETRPLPPGAPDATVRVWARLGPMFPAEAAPARTLPEAARSPDRPATHAGSHAGTPARSSYWSWPEAHPQSLQPKPRATAQGVVNPNESTMMTKNVGNLDRTLRIVAGVALIALAALGTIGPWGWIGAVPLATALLGWCPMYSLLGLKT